MTTTTIPKSVLQYLRDLSAHNDRDWFNAHKDRYQEEYGHMIGFAEALIDEMSHYDHLVPMSGKQSLFRIYRDTRFSKDKTPYKTHFSGGMKRATELLRGGYYYHVEPGSSFAGGGFWGPNAEDLKRIREELAAHAEPLRAIIADPVFRETFGELQGDKVKTAPQGFRRDHPNIDLIRHKQFIVMRKFSDQEVTAPGFLGQLVATFRNMRPFFDYMSEVLTTDANGEPLYG